MEKHALPFTFVDVTDTDYLRKNYSILQHNYKYTSHSNHVFVIHSNLNLVESGYERCYTEIAVISSLYTCTW